MARAGRPPGITRSGDLVVGRFASPGDRARTRRDIELDHESREEHRTMRLIRRLLGMFSGGSGRTTTHTHSHATAGGHTPGGGLMGMARRLLR
jgi:hypothetical protein